MIYDVRVLNPTSLLGIIPVNSAAKPYQVVNIEGLGPVKASISTTSKGYGPGVNYGGSIIDARNIVLDIQLNGVGEKARVARLELYEMFPIGERINLYFYEGTDVYNIPGYVESVAPKLFTRKPTLQISVLCTDTYFRRYPLDHEVLLPTGGVPLKVVYGGRVDNGMTIDIAFNSGVQKKSGSGSINIRQVTSGKPVREFNIPDEELIYATGAAFTPGDIIKINTTPGSKKATLTRGGTEYNIMSTLENYRGVYLNENQWPLFEKHRDTTVAYKSTLYPTESLNVNLHWEELIEGL